MASSDVVSVNGKAAAAAEWNGEDVPRALGRYLLLKRIARGGMGEVFLASTTGIEGAERPVVVKIIRREHAKDPSFIARFMRSELCRLIRAAIGLDPATTVTST